MSLAQSQSRNHATPKPPAGARERIAALLRERLPRSEAELRRLTAFVFWVVSIVFSMTLSFIPATAPDDAHFWRLALGVPAGLIALAHVTVLKRFSYRVQEHLLVVSALAGCAANAILLQIMPATWAILALHIASVIWVAYFFGPRVTFSIAAVATAVALSPLIVDNAGVDQPTDASRMVVYIPALWAVVGALHAQKRAVDRAFEQANTLAFRDPLTGLENLRALNEQFNHFDSLYTGQPLGLLLIDVDNFKRANTLYGHVGGDHSLRTISHQLLRCARKGHLIARIGGDEFAVLMPGVRGERAQLMADFYRSAVVAADSEVDLDGVHLDASVGVAVYPDDGTKLDDLLTVADRSMYAEKAQHTAAATVPSDLPVAVTPAWLMPEHEPRADSAPANTVRARLLRLWLSRPMFARAICLYWAGSAVVFAAAALTPGAKVGAPLGVAAFAVLGVLMGGVVFAVGPRHRGIVNALADICALSGQAALIAMFDGASSPAMPLIMVYVIYQSWFWGVRSVHWRLLAALAVTFSPVFYDPVFSAPGWSDDAAFLLAVGTMTISLTTILSIAIAVLLGIRRRARQLSLVDPLTGLPNRRAFARRVDEVLVLQDSGDMRRRPAVVMIDLDDFKLINSERGHHAGDELLKRVGEYVAMVARTGDLVARIGGDEFAAVLPEAGEEGARALAERFIDAVADATAEIAEQTGIHVTASAGFALYPQHGADLDALMRAADRAMMSVKRAGKAGTAVGEAAAG